MELVFNLRDYRLSFPGLVKKARKMWPRYPGTRTDQSQRWDTTFLPTVSPPPPVVANDLFRRASRIRYQRLLGLMGPRLQPFSSGRIRFLPRPARRNHEDKGGVARTTRVQTPRVLFARFVAGRSFRNLGYRTPINPSRDRCHCDLHDHEQANIGVEEKELISFE